MSLIATFAIQHALFAFCIPYSIQCYVHISAAVHCTVTHVSRRTHDTSFIANWNADRIKSKGLPQRFFNFKDLREGEGGRGRKSEGDR